MPPYNCSCSSFVNEPPDGSALLSSFGFLNFGTTIGYIGSSNNPVSTKQLIYFSTILDQSLIAA